MKEIVIIVKCEVPSEAYQILTTLRKKPEDKGFRISHGALVKKEAGELSLEDGFVAEDEKGRGTEHCRLGQDLFPDKILRALTG